MKLRLRFFDSVGPDGVGLVTSDPDCVGAECTAKRSGKVKATDGERAIGRPT